MSVSWQEFEQICFDYLSRTYGSKAKFEIFGQSDSSLADVKVNGSGDTFYIEIKKPDAQSGQFVLLPDKENEEFVFSPRNKSIQNEFTDIMINYMNLSFHEFNNAGTSGKSLDIDEDVFNDWITNYYASNNVRYFITKGSDFIIFPTDKFSEYFDTSASYRVKRSGSSEPAKRDRKEVIEYLESEYPVDNTFIEGRKLFVSGDASISKERFILGDYEFYISPRDNNLYEIRKLSNTYNMNVIFSISLRKEQDPLDLADFENNL